MKNLIKIQNEFYTNYTVYDHIKEALESITYNLDNRYLAEDTNNLLLYLQKKFRVINGFITSDVRFDYVYLQNAIDELYKSDTTLTNIHIDLQFKLVEGNEKRSGYLKFNIIKS